MGRSGDIWNHIYSGIFLEITAHCDYDLVRYRSIPYLLTYLPTYLREISSEAIGNLENSPYDIVCEINYSNGHIRAWAVFILFVLFFIRSVCPRSKRKMASAIITSECTDHEVKSSKVKS